MKVTKKLLALLLGVTLIAGLGISVGATETESTNLFANPSFENGLEGWTAKRTSYQQESAAFAEYSEAFPAYSEDAGTKYVQYPQNYDAAVLLQKVNNLKGKSTYKFSGYMYSTSTNTTFTEDAYISLQYTFYSDDTALGTATEETLKVPVATWTKLQGFITLPENANSVEIGIIHTWGSTFTRCYDELCLEEVVLTSADGNFLLNGSFENGLTGWEINCAAAKPAAQVAYGGTLTAPEKGSGTYCAQFPAGNASSSLTQRVDGLKSGYIYTFSGYYHTYRADAVADAYAKFIYTFYKNGVIEGTTTEVFLTTPINSWTKVEQDIFIPAGVNGIEIGFKTTNGSSHIRSYDNLSFKCNENLIANGGFEDSNANDKTAEGWLLTKGASTFAFSADSHSGEVAYTADDYGRIEQAIPALDGTRYKLTYWFKSADADSEKASYVRVRFFSTKPSKSNTNPGTSTSAINVNSMPLVSSDGWQKHVAYFTTPAGTAGISVVLHSYTSGGDKAVCMYDDVELVISDDTITFLGFTENNTENTGYETNQNTTGSYIDAGEYAVEAKAPATTLQSISTLPAGKAVYVSAISFMNTDVTLAYGLFSMDGDVKTLEAVEIAEPDADGFMTAGISVPATGTYYLEVYLWNGTGGMKPIMAPIKLS